jgi:hemolysin III
LHQWGLVAAVPLGVILGAYAEGVRAKVAAAVFAGSVVAMFGASALYHRITWSPEVRRWLRRLDHAGIYALIAGTYTPFGLLVLEGAWRWAVLAVVWGGALGAAVLKLCWVAAPKWLAAVISVVLGWIGVLVYPQLVAGAGVAVGALVLAGGLLYTAGAVVYVRRRPDPRPAVFGYHELFHALVLAAVALQYTAVALVVLPG